MKINWQTVFEMVIAFSIAAVLTEFVISPLAEKVMDKVKATFEKA